MLDSSYKVNSPGVIHDEIDSEVVIVDLNIGHYFRINKESSQLWNLIIKGNSISQILTSCENRSDLQLDMAKIVQNLLNLQIIYYSNHYSNKCRDKNPAARHSIHVQHCINLSQNNIL